MNQKIKFLLICILFITSIFKSECQIRAVGGNVEELKNAIVEVQTGLKTYDGNFYPIKSSSGFLVCNDSGNVYIITTYHSTVISKKEEKKACKANKLDINVSSVTTDIRIIVEGDVASSVSVKASSEQDDFCVLEASDVLNEKQVLHLENKKEINIGDNIYALGVSGFGTGALTSVEIHAGTVQNNAVTIDENAYIQHSAVVMPEQSGGALLSEDGYLLGINNVSVILEGIEAYYSVPINKIQVILDNFGIDYESRTKDEAIVLLKSTYEECQEMIASEQYKKSSLTIMEEVLKQTEEVLAMSKVSEDEIITVQNRLEQSKALVVKKLSKLKIIKYILLLILIVSVMNGVRLGWKYRNIKKMIESKKIQDSTTEGRQNQVSMESEDQTVILDYPLNQKRSENMRSGLGNTFQKDKAYFCDLVTGAKTYIDSPSYAIGKSEENDLKLDNNAVSRRHAVVLWQAGEYYIKDLDSSNGTYVNGKLIQGEETKLKNHDIVILADVEMEFVMKEV